jgi:radical SAM-linked protein
MSQPSRFRYRIRFSKAVSMRFTSHLDLQRTWERWLRRANLPVLYSQGYTPRAKIQIGMALPLGFSAREELLDFWLEQEMEPTEILAALRRTRPPGLQIIAAEPVPDHSPAVQTQVEAAIYRATLPEGLDLQKEVSELLSREHAHRFRRGKEYDLRPLIQALEIRRAPSGRYRLHMRLSALEGATGRPDEVLLELGADPAEANIERAEILLTSGGAPR